VNANVSAVERAFQIAKSGNVRSVEVVSWQDAVAFAPIEGCHQGGAGERCSEHCSGIGAADVLLPRSASAISASVKLVSEGAWDA
jgi:hypothetical protein